MRTTVAIALAAAAAMVVSAPPAGAGTEVPVALEDVPADLIDAVRARMPGLKLTDANTEAEDDGDLVYEIRGVTGDARKVEFDIRPDGEIDEIEVEFAADMVPGAVMKALADRMPGFTPTFIEASHSASMKVVGYEFVGTMGDSEIDVEVSADGRHIAIADQ